MKIKLNWFSKAVKEEVKADESKATENENLQGGYTDHADEAYSLRQRLSPLHGEELEAFDYVMNLMASEHPEDYRDQSQLIQHAFDEQFFIFGKSGELRVNQNPPRLE